MNTRNIFIVLAVVIVLLFAGWYYYRGGTDNAPSPTSTSTTTYAPQTDDSTASINRQLDSIDTGANVDADFTATDSDINSL